MMKKTLLALITSAMFVSPAFSAREGLSDNIHDRYWDVTNADGSLKSDDIINQRLSIVDEAKEPYTEQEREAFRKKYQAKYEKYIVLDGLVVGGMNSNGKGFPMMSKAQFDTIATTGEVDYDVMSITISNGTDKTVSEVYDRADATSKHLYHDHGHHLVKSVDDIRLNHKEGKVSYFYNFQAIDHLQRGSEEPLSHIPKFASEGVKVMSFSYNISNDFSGSGDTNSLKSGPEGLTPLGIEAVKAMNEAGVVVDCSHDSDQTCIDIAKYSTKPVVASHSNARALRDIDRNISDEAIIAIAKTDGVIGVNFIGGFLNDQATASGDDIAAHIVYIADLISRELGVDGKKHVGIGADYVHNYIDALQWIVRAPHKFPATSAGGGYASLSEYGRPSDIWAVVDSLETKHGWSEQEIAGVLGENTLRVYEANWK
ncbi:dipeptidase [Vibrio comitans]